MRNKPILTLLAAVALLGSAWAQGAGGTTDPNQPVVDLESFRIANQPQMVNQATVNAPGVSGRSSLYYWIVTNATGGQSTPAGPFELDNTTDVPSATEQVNVVGTPVQNAISYDVLRTPTAAMPTGACNCAVAKALAYPSVTDTGGALQSYTVAPVSTTGRKLALANVYTSPGENCLAIVTETGDTTCLTEGGETVELQTNGVDNDSQTLLNLVQGSGITLENTSGGDVTISATGGGGGGNAYAPQVALLSAPVTLGAGVQGVVLSETVTFPAAAGVYHADVRYLLWAQVGAHYASTAVIDTTNNIQIAGDNINSPPSGTTSYGAAEVPAQTYSAGQVVTFELVAVSGDAPTFYVDSTAVPAVSPVEPSFLEIIPIGPPTGAGGAPSEPLYSVQTNYPDGSFGNGLGDFLDLAPILGPLTFTGDGIDWNTIDDGTYTYPEYNFSISETGTSIDPCPACLFLNTADNVQGGGNIDMEAYGVTGGAVKIVGSSPAQGNYSYSYEDYVPGTALIEGSSDATGSLTRGTVTINGQPYDDLAGALADVGNVAVNACGTIEDGIPAGGESCSVTLTANGLLQSYGYGGNVNLDAFGPTLAADTPGANSGNVNLSAYSAGVASNNGSINLTTYNSGGSGPFDDTENDITLFALNHLYLQSADLVTGTAPICPNGPDGALVNDGSCGGGLPAVFMVAEGSLALGTAAVSSYTCNTVTQAATEVDAMTDYLNSASVGSFSSIAGYGPNISGSLDVNVYIDPGGGQVDADVCNRTPAPLTPDAANISYAVLRAAL